MDPVEHDVVVYPDTMPYLKTIEGEDIERPFICYIGNLLWLLSDKGTHVCFYWLPSHCGIEGNRGRPPKEILNIDPLASVNCADLKPVMNSYSQIVAHIKGMLLHMTDIFISWNQHWGHQRNASTSVGMSRLQLPDFEVAIPRPTNPISPPMTHKC